MTTLDEPAIVHRDPRIGVLRTVPLTRGLVSIVDPGDYDDVMSHGPWYASAGGANRYARKQRPRQGGRQRPLTIHTFLTGWDFVDHINGDGLDNRRVNLRPANIQTNNWNARLRRDSTTGLKGVAVEREGVWRAHIRHHGRRIHLGMFPSPESAARAYDEAAVALFGEFARTNHSLGLIGNLP